MKTLTALAFLCLILTACKKDAQPVQLTLSITKVKSQVTYNVTVMDNSHTGQVSKIQNGDADQTIPVYVYHGDHLILDYNFSAPGADLSLGLIDLYLDGKVLYHGDGLYGHDMTINVP